ncbi:MAG: sensor histidine kinase [Spirochaetes bacterium]|nr:sensor histidine kinase [Spirochaetota bacterium]
MIKPKWIQYSLISFTLWCILLFPSFLHIIRDKEKQFDRDLRVETLTYLRPLSEYINARLQQYELLMDAQSDFLNWNSFLRLFQKDVIRFQETKNILLLNDKGEIEQFLHPIGFLEKNVIDTFLSEFIGVGSSFQYSFFKFQKNVYIVLFRPTHPSNKGLKSGITLILSSLQLLPEHISFLHPLQWISLIEPKGLYMLLYRYPRNVSDEASIEEAIRTVTSSHQGTGIEVKGNIVIGWDSLRSLPFKLLIAADLQDGLRQLKQFTTMVFVGGYFGATFLFLLVWLLVLYRVKTLSQTRDLKIKESILRETHHRIKNNIQTISSLLDLQRDSVQDPFMRQSFALASSRLRVIAQLHEELYRQDSLEAVIMKKYCLNLLTILSELYDFNTNQITLQTEMDDELVLDLKRTQACGFIIHELVTNSLKHAFPKGKGGTILVRIRRNGKTIFLSVEDDGIGCTGNMKNASGLGLVILRSIVQQLNGSFTMDGTAGMKVQVTFPI